MGTKQTATNQATLMAFTSTPVPKLMGDHWTHLFPEVLSPTPGASKSPKDSYKSFQEDLAAMAARCDHYNEDAADRPFPECFPLYTTNPKYLDTSISV